ncbi:MULTISPECIES: ribonuclease T2 family protein [unclassified Sphingobium]|uniref:ribonuclease T2 family protein n=1 Tax=unclassified Sphingobium TaxID=2611147 RepID=UPI0007700EC3|nr:MULTISPECIES: ribonuclease T [unclassified Sphingobium]AMK22208.1 ribonuclease T2 [Sphingobium sp. TKS]
MLKLALPLLLLAAPASALAQAAQCSLPAQMPRPRPDLPSESQGRRLLPIGGYTLALTWSPQYCAGAKGGDDAFQCSGRNGRFGFTLHGLWPDGVGKEWPQYCRATDLLPRPVIWQNLCVTPSVQLLQHEWAKHGTCMATRPELYFNLSRALYQSIRYPDMAALARRKTLTVGRFTEAFAAANQGMRADMMRVTATRDNRLSEVWLCMDKALEFARCPKHQGGTSNQTSLRIAPGPNIPNPKRAKPAPASRSGLILHLDPNAELPEN